MQRAVFALVAMSILAYPSALFAQRDPESTIIRMANLLTRSDGDVESRWKPLLGASDPSELLERIAQVREQATGAVSREVEIQSATACRVLYEFRDHELHVALRLNEENPPRLIQITSKHVPLDEADTAPITWATLDKAMERAADRGFSGAVLIARGGKIVLHEGYGLANREKNIRNTRDTVFAIGSAPIDFTHAGILLLKDEGKLSLDDPITKFFENVPDDKQAMTVRHLMTGKSGLLDFHELPSDKNPDHSWIDRDEAIRRIMNQRLLFAPGQGRKASHSAWGLLAAVIEIVSGESYPEFTKKRLFEPAGMKDTGFFGEPIPEGRVAVGYGRVSSTPNSPPHWGQTSWMVMGSGGQVSTLQDMYRWEVAMRNESILSPESTTVYLRNRTGVCQDGDSFGFEFMHSTDPERLFMIISNAIHSRDDRRDFDRLGRRIYEMTFRTSE